VTLSSAMLFLPSPDSHDEAGKKRTERKPKPRRSDATDSADKRATFATDVIVAVICRVSENVSVSSLIRR